MRTRSLVSFALPFFLTFNVRAQQKESPCPCTVDGTIVDSVTGSPIEHAAIQLLSETGRTVFTDSSGRFSFSEVSSTSSALRMNKPGYLPSNSFDSFFQYQNLSSDEKHLSVILKLVPQAVITGQLTDENGDPVERFVVKALPADLSGRHIPFWNPGQASTDDEGRFRIAGLSPGVYYLYAASSMDANDIGVMQVASPKGFAPVYFPGVSDISAAAPVKVAPGQRQNLHFSTSIQPYHFVSGTVSAIPNGAQTTTAYILDPSNPAIARAIVVDPSTGAFHSPPLPPGLLKLYVQSRTKEDVWDATAIVNLQSDCTGLQLNLSRGASMRVRFTGDAVASAAQISGFVQFGKARSDFSWASATLKFPMWIQSYGIGAIVTLDPKTGDNPTLTQTIRGIPEGTYGLEFPIAAPDMYVESATLGSMDVLNNRVTIGPSTQPTTVEVVLRNGAAHVEGSVSSSDGILGGSVCSLTTTGFTSQCAPIQPNGRFRVDHLAPGTHRLVAIADLASLDDENSQQLQRLAAKSKEIELTSGKTAVIQLELVRMWE